ncbi:MAG: polyphenol oxidase family protein [Actinomycetota bacterium]|nr:polyphenol oxidase family protein [Actinomycetota bacterium]
MRQPQLVRSAAGEIGIQTDPQARAQGVLVGFTNRRGGVSSAPYDSLNLAARVGDEEHAVHANRRRAADAVGFDHSRLVLARQVHEAHVIEVGGADAGVLGEGDGLLTRDRGPVLSILTADCAPVVVAGDAGVAVLHAGWRGIVAGVVEKGVAALGGGRAAWIGPCIHACCYEVGPEVIAAFEAHDLPIADDRHVDPARAAETALRRSGVDAVAVSDDCTHCNPDYFSYRRDGVTGRQGAFAALVEPGAARR